MAEQLKNMYFTKSSLNGMADTMQRFYPAFDKKRFLELIFDGLENMELKEKMRHTTLCLRKTLPDSLAEALTILEQAAPFVKGFEAMSLPDYAELYGTDKENWDMAFKAMGVFTQYSSSEFAVRPFLDSDPEKALAYMKKWAADKNPKLRRLASEGCRPRLPWAMALPKFKKDPAPILPILEKLKDDPSEDVRRSVANNINDISKDNPEVALELCEKWTGHSQETDGVIKHACRTMLKAGNKRAMVLFGYSDPAGIKVENLTLDKDKIQLGEALNFFFDITISAPGKSKVRLEYTVYFMKANGKLSGKVFKITENDYQQGTHSFKKKHAFVKMSTRKYYTGEHQVSIIINGEEKAKTTLQLEIP